MANLARSFLVPLVLLPLSGCVTYWKGQEMESDIAALQGQVETLTEAQRQTREKQQQDAEALEQRVTQLESRLGEAIAQLQGGSADRGLAIEKLAQELREVRGELAELRHKQQSGGLGVIAPVEPAPGAPPLPEGEAELYRYGWEKKRTGDCDEAIRAFSEYAAKFPGSRQADNALFLLADCLHVKRDYTHSITTLQAIMKSYAEGDKVDDALLLMHDNFVALGRCKDAIPFLESLIADYPRSNRIAEARRKLAHTKRTCK